jgi:hypothetical protein
MGRRCGSAGACRFFESNLIKLHVRRIVIGSHVEDRGNLSMGMSFLVPIQKNLSAASVAPRKLCCWSGA